MIKFPSPLKLTITALSHEGRGIAHHEGKVVFVFGALPGETALTRFVGGRSSYWEGVAEQIENPDPHRATPRCPHFGVCGGCALQHMTPLAQITHKQMVLQEQLSHANIAPKAWLPPLMGEPWHYRTKARLGVRFVKQKGKVLIGFHEQRTSKVTDCHQCDILPEAISALLPILSTTLQSLQAFDTIPQIELAVGKEAPALIVRHMAPLSDPDLTVLIHLAQEYGFWLYLQPKGPDTVRKVWPSDHDFFLSYSLTIPPYPTLHYDFHPLDFTQVNPDMNVRMVAQAMHLLDLKQEDSVLDLFCGLGNFTLPLAQQAGSVVGVEGEARLVGRATQNAEHNQLTNVTFHSANLFEPITHFPWAKQAYSKIVLDPPRAGAELLIPFLNQSQANILLYISCNPATFLRDTALLVQTGGWTLETVGVMDMFPHTKHTEVMAVLKK
jgi:23S rRNA (uracil1939-C5)-methyltransferase